MDPSEATFPRQTRDGVPKPLAYRVTGDRSVHFIRYFSFVVAQRRRRSGGMKSVKKDVLPVGQSSREERLSVFGRRLHSLTETFYSEILDDSQKKVVIRNAEDFQGLHEIRSNDFTFEACSASEMKSKDDLSFTFHSIDQSRRQTSSKNPIQVSNRGERREGERNSLLSRDKT